MSSFTVFKFPDLQQFSLCTYEDVKYCNDYVSLFVCLYT